MDGLKETTYLKLRKEFGDMKDLPKSQKALLEMTLEQYDIREQDLDQSFFI